MPFQRKDIELLAEIATHAADAEILPRYRKLDGDAVREKTSALDLVTDADEGAEAHMRAACAKAFPKALFVGEESVEKDRSLLTQIAAADLAIVVDPVDGTNNFAWGLPLFGVILAVIARGETVAGLIYDPIGRDCSFTVRGHGAWHKGENGTTRDLKAAKPRDVSELVGVSSWYHMPEPRRTQLTANFAKVRAAFSYRCAAYEYRLLADGHIDFSVSWKLMPWDHAAGVLMHNEAGGYSALFDGKPYSPLVHGGGMMLAPDKTSWQALYEALLTPAA